MRRVIFSIMIALVAMLNTYMAAENASVQMRGDSIVVMDGGDTVTVAMSGLKQLVGKISNKMGDTLVDKSGEAIAVDMIDENYTPSESDLAVEQIFSERQNGEQIFIAIVTGIVFGSILLIVLFSLIAYYMRRRAKYRIIEKAIENGYELPESFYGNSRNQRPVMPVPPVTPQQPVQPAQPNAPQQPVMPASGNGDLLFRLRWHRGARSGMTLSVVGLCFVVFGLAIGEEFFAAIGLAIILIGAAKIALGYFDVRVPMYPQQPVHPNVPQQPVHPNVPQQPVTPPPFNDGRASNMNNTNA
ncbi:MAG: hypothetical protein ACI4AN_00880 [Muribaculaceae bacterium]